MHKDYYEGILQLRDTNNEIVNFVKRQVAKRIDVDISKVVKVINGIDMYFTSQRYLKALGKKLQKHFKGEMKISSKLYTRNRITSKEVHRVNVLFKPAKFKVGDIVKYKGSKLKIVKLGNKVACKYLDTGKSITLNYSSLSK